MTQSPRPDDAAQPPGTATTVTPSTTPDPLAMIGSKPYLGALGLAAVLGIPVSAIAYGFLALVAKIQQCVFTDLPTSMTGGPAPAWWPMPCSRRCSSARPSGSR